MLWNELEFELQSQVLTTILNLIDEEPNKKKQKALMAAFLELRMWSNFPCPVIDNPDIVQAQDCYED
jgi:hypothetical protein